MTRITEEQAKEYFIKLTCDAYSKEDLARQIWEYMDTDKREPYFRELEEKKDVEKTKMTRAEKISERLEELEKTARYNRDKWDDTPLIDWLEDDEQEEYNKLKKEYNNLGKKD